MTSMWSNENLKKDVLKIEFKLNSGTNKVKKVFFEIVWQIFKICFILLKNSSRFYILTE